MTPIQWKKTTAVGINHILDEHGTKELNELRKECLSAMSQIDSLSNHKWHFFRKLLNEYDFESREFSCNRAFYKLWEILKKHPDVAETKSASLTTLHLAEAPGSFVQVVKKMFPESNSVAVSKPPSTYAEVVRKGKSIPVFNSEVLQEKDCRFYYTDLMVNHNILWLKEHEGNRFDFITADGGFDEEERYDAKEILHYNLILGEIIAILLLQKIGGGCVIKIFETFTETTISMLWLLCQHYGTFEFVKPATSRPTNAEKYIVCKAFKGCQYDQRQLCDLMANHITRNMVLDVNVPIRFQQRVVEMAKEFSRQQIDTINRVISFVHENSHGRYGSIYIDKRQYNEQKRKSFNEWKAKFALKAVAIDDEKVLEFDEISD